MSLKVRDICHGDQVASRATVMQHKTQRPVQFEITPVTRDAVQKWIKLEGLDIRRISVLAADVSFLAFWRTHTPGPLQTVVNGRSVEVRLRRGHAPAGSGALGSSLCHPI